MHTIRRLNECYQKARVIEFDNDSRFIMFSDIHRGDNSLSDEFAHNQNLYYYALSYYYENGYRYIELGDGDELWEHSNFDVILSAHSDVFMLLRRFYLDNRLDIIYGNHDIARKRMSWVRRHLYNFQDDYLDESDDLFDKMEIHESLILRYKETGQEFLLVHGHQGDLFNDRLWPVSMIALRFFWRFFHGVGFQNPSSPAKSRVKRHKIEVNFTKWIKKNRVGIICGHTHRPKLSKVNEAPYFNTGCCIHPRGINGIEIKDGKIQLIDWRIRPEGDGVLRIKKKIIRGPVDIKSYHKIEAKLGNKRDSLVEKNN